MRKKQLCFFLFPLITLLLVSACTQDDIPSHSTISNIVEKEHINTTQSTGDIHLITGVDGIIRNATASVETGYYELLPREDGAFNISYTDYQTATRVYLCNRPECKHCDTSCTSWLSSDDCAGGAGLFTDGNKLYVQRQGAGAEIGHPETITGLSPSKIIEMDLNGNNRKELLVLTGADSIWGAIAADKNHFFFLLDSVIQKNDELSVTRTLVAFVIETREIVPLKEFDLDTHLIGTSNDGLVFKVFEQGSGNQIQSSIYLFNLSNGNFEKIKQWSGNHIISQVSNNTLYCIDSEHAQLTAFHFDTGDEMIITAELPLHKDDTIIRLGIWDNHFMYRAYEHGSHLTNDIHDYSVDLKDGRYFENTLKYTAFNITNSVNILAESSNYFLVGYDKRSQSIKQIGPDGTSYSLEVDELLQGLIKKEDFWNNHAQYVPIDNTESSNS